MRSILRKRRNRSLGIMTNRQFSNSLSLSLSSNYRSRELRVFEEPSISVAIVSMKSRNSWSRKREGGWKIKELIWRYLETFGPRTLQAGFESVSRLRNRDRVRFLCSLTAFEVRLDWNMDVHSARSGHWWDF